MILLIDNYDSFTYNLVQFLADLAAGKVPVLGLGMGRASRLFATAHKTADGPVNRHDWRQLLGDMIPSGRPGVF